MIEDKCKVCGHPYILTEVFCPECGFERHVLPAQVSMGVEAYEKKRVEEYLEKWKQTQEQKREIEKLSFDLQTAKDKSMVDKQELLKLRANLEEATNKASAYAKGKERELSVLQKEYATAMADKKSIEKQLLSEQDAHSRTKQQIKELKEKIKYLSINNQQPACPKPKQPHPNTQKTVIGKVMFSSGGRTESVELYSELCRVAAPRWTNIIGDLFEINGSHGLYRLIDIKGNMCDRHDKPVPSQGTTIRNNDVFTYGNVTIRFSLPEIDYDSLY